MGGHNSTRPFVSHLILVHSEESPLVFQSNGSENKVQQNKVVTFITLLYITDKVDS